jgi:hypothetical protein
MPTTTTTTFDCIAERELEYREKTDVPPCKAVVRLGRPYFDPPPPGQEGWNSGNWVGPFEIAVEGKTVRSSRAFGADAIQALQLAMVHVGLDLQQCYPGQFTLQGGQSETGFPSSTT